jgi:hypothetical protein
MDMELNRRAPDLDCIEKTANNIHCICKYQNGTFQVKIAKFYLGCTMHICMDKNSTFVFQNLTLGMLNKKVVF